MQQPVLSSGRNAATRLALWARRVGLWRKLTTLLLVAVTLTALATYALFANADPSNPRPKTLYVLLIVNAMLALPLIALVARFIVQLVAARRSGLAGARLHGRMVSFFSLVAITPTIVMAAFTIFFFEEGMQTWFSERVKTVVGSATSVAEAYIQEHQKVIKADLLGMANDLDADALVLSQDRVLLEQALSLQARLLSLSEAIIFDGNGQAIVRANAEFSLGGGDPFPPEALAKAASGQPLILASEDDDRVRALVKLSRFFDAYLYISRYVDPKALALVYQTRTATTEFEVAEKNLADYRLLFSFTYMGVALIVLLSAILIGLWFANRLVKPISSLVSAAERVRQGDLDAKVPSQLAYDELGMLSRAFNRMTSQIKAQRDELVAANRAMDERRRFTEAVLSGVSSGVLGLDLAGTITLPNRSATQLLEMSESELVGRPLIDVLPEAAGVLEAARERPDATAQDHLVVRRKDSSMNFLVRIAAEAIDDRIEGFVATFDDITEQITAQRTAAWADVARRIAHEIKNPLTPIQLSAERLKRKYLKEIHSDPEVFAQCTDTIIRQVGDLRAIVDEFSAFARMPTPVYRLTDMVDVVRRAVFLHEVAHPEIAFRQVLPKTQVELVCDGRLLAQALTNLLKNAVEAIAARAVAEDDQAVETPLPLGAIEIELVSDEEEVVIIIRDDGAGFPEKLKDRLTEPYVTTRAKGTGLGLAIVKKIMEEHGAALLLHNRDHGGAQVTMVFNRTVLVRRVTTTEAADKPGIAAAGE